MKDFLIEIGTEELPPKALKTLINDFASGVQQRLAEARLEFSAMQSFATPRRLALIVSDLVERQADQAVTLKGPPVKIAFDDGGNPTPAAIAFAKKCGVDVAELSREATDKGEWLVFEKHESGIATQELLGDLLSDALLAMAIPRRMRWGDSSIEFVRPVHWVLALHGDKGIDIDVLGVRSGTLTYGHRFLSAGAIEIPEPSAYATLLHKPGYVVADMTERRRLIVDGVAEAANAVGGTAVGSDALYDEVNALVEWPVPVTGGFEPRFLQLPHEVITATLSGHQRYFSIKGPDGALLPRFITVSNIASTDPSKVIDGNERVVRPRLSDAEFFWKTDLKTSLAARREKLSTVVYQQGLGTLADKVDRVTAIAVALAERLDVDTAACERAAALCKADLVTGMVGEFPELQGVVGRYYATEEGEAAEVATAIEEHYLPRHATDALPASAIGQVLAIADRLDTLAGLFVLGKKPSGNRDPFGLRRAALAIVRIVLECRLDIGVESLIEEAVGQQPVAAPVTKDIAAFIQERLRGHALERGYSQEVFAAVAASQPPTLLDFEKRLLAVSGFREMAEAASLAAANKRIANILKKNTADSTATLQTALFVEDAERALYAELTAAAEDIAPLMSERQYAETLQRLAGLRESVDAFFDGVMVMADDAATRANRLALLAELRSMFLGVADISRL